MHPIHNSCFPIHNCIGISRDLYALISRVLFSRPSISNALWGASGYLVASVAALDFRPARRATSRAQPHRVRKDAAVVSEIAAGRIALFTPRLRVALVSVALALRRGRQSGLSGPTTGPSPAFARHPALCSSDFPLPRGVAVARRYQVLPNPSVVYIL